MSKNILDVRNLTKDYDAYRAIDGISFEIQKGEVLGLLGPNGAGKSTTIQILLGITLSTKGSIHYFGKDFRKHRQHCLQRINFASAYNTLQGRISVKENLLVFAKLYGIANPSLKIAELLEYFEIGDLANHKYWDLSAGERTRVNLVKSMLNEPELILMDEPTASLDPDIADKTLSLIENLRTDRKLSILFTSHNMSEVTRVCDRVIFLDKGHIVRKGSPSELTKNVDEVIVKLTYKGKQKDVTQIVQKLGLSLADLTPHELTLQTTNNQIAVDVAAIVNAGIKVIDTEVEKPTLEHVFLGIARKDKS